MKSQTSAAVALLTPVVSGALYDQVISTASGPVQGAAAFDAAPVNMSFTNWADIAVWKGIPFAADTSGNNRFKSPQAAESWTSTLNATTFGDVCPGATLFPSDTLVISENCLNLNVWSAANSTDAKLPVVMWSYPAVSTAAYPLFDGAGMADKGVVFVNYNYRTGSLGWLASAELNEERFLENGHNSSGNYGMLDQFAALQWIRDNIDAFGGDPDRITVMGQSAGSAATQHILNSELVPEGAIVGAIIESGVRDPHDPEALTLAENYLPLETNVATGAAFLASLNVSTIAELRALPFDTVSTAFNSDWAFSATLDFYAMPETYLNTLLQGIAKDVPIITGNTKDESGAVFDVEITLDEYLADLNTTFGEEFAAKYFAVYPANDTASASSAYNAMWSDRSKIGTYNWSRLWAMNATSAVYPYYWTHAPPGQTQGAYHESEINYVLNNLYDTDSPWDTVDYEIAARMNEYWVNFIKTGNPNGDGLPEFAAASDDSLSVMELGDAWEQIPLGSDPQVQLVNAWFDTITPV